MLNHNSLVNLFLRSALILTTSGFAVVFGNSAFAQIQPDNTLGSENSIVNDIDALNKRIDGGVKLDANLFHSFQEFNVSEGGSVYFANPQGITDIFSRVTGNNPSNIFGKLGVLGDANLFLINPNGIVFGENASLDVGGSFVASTANAIDFGEQGSFSASNPETPRLLTVNPSAFFFNQVSSANITVRSVAPAGTSPSGIDVVGLRVPDGSSLLLVGGDVNFEGGQSSALGGHLELAGLKEPESINLHVNNKTLKLGFPDDVLLANVTLKNDARASVRGSGGGNLVVNADTFNATSGGRLVAGTEKPVKGGDITVNASNFIITGIGSSGNSSGLYNQTVIDAEGSPGNIFVNTKIFDASSNARIQNSINTEAVGNAGDIDISADFLSLRYGSQIGTLNFGQGNSGNIEINADTVEIEDGGQVFASSFNRGDGGNIEINADTVELIGVSINKQFRSGVFSETSGVDSSGKAGDVTVDARILKLQDGGAISTQTFNQGKGGNLTVTARESLNISGISPSSLPKPNNPFFRSALVTTTGGSGSAGNIKIVDTGIIKIDDGGVISASSLNQGDGGNIEINADTVDLIGVSPNGEFRNGLFSLNSEVDSFSTAGNGVFSITAGVDSSAKAGDITLNTRNLNLRDGAVLSTQTTNEGEAGNITIQNDGRLQLTNSSVLTNSSESSGGAIDITAKDIYLFGNSNIRTDVPISEGEAGNITLTADIIVALDKSDILSFAPEGQGGNIRFNTKGFFSKPLYKPTPPIRDAAALQALDNNNRVDVNASGTVSGTITGVPDTTFIQDSLTDLPDNQIDTNVLVANSCIVRSNQQNGTFLITGSGGLPQNPSDAPLSNYSTGSIRSIPNNSEKSPASNRQNWKIGDPVVEPQGVYKLPNGQLVLSRECR